MQHPEYYEGLDLESVNAIGMIAGIKLDPEEKDQYRSALQ